MAAGLAAGLTRAEIAALENWRASPLFNEDDLLVVGYAEKVTDQPSAVTDEDVDTLRRRFSDEQIVELTLAIAAYNMTNRFNLALDVELEPLFHRHER